MTFRSISGASVSANSSNPPSVSLADFYQQGGSAFDSTASFESSTSFTSMPLLYPPPRGSSVGSPGTVSLGSDPLSGHDPTLNWRSIEEETERQCSESVNFKFKRSLSENVNEVSIKPSNSLKKIFRRAISSVTPIKGVLSKSISEKENKTVEDDVENDEEDPSVEINNLQWAQGRAGEDRIHIVISEDYGWVFVGIYDGFNGPDATDYLLNNLFPAIHNELKELLQKSESEKNGEPLSHSDVLMALSKALRKTEDDFLTDSDEVITMNPVLAMMGSCVLVMLMKGDDVYLMNVGDSRAVLGQISGYDLCSVQLTVDHSTHVKEVTFETWVL